MRLMLNTAGWILLGLPAVLVIYTYIGYPALLRLVRTRPATGVAPDAAPVVTVVVPAYNEEAQIRGAIQALLEQDYDPESLQILVLSDASTDDTDRIVAEYAGQGVELLRMPVRGGKTAAENASCDLLRGDIVVNTDASIRLHPQAVRRLVHAMQDPRVGVASTRDVSISRSEASANATEAGYVGFEMHVRALETRSGGIVGASGSGYAIRRSLHRLPVRADLSRDFSAALTARTHSFIAVSVDDALAYVPRTASLRAEYRRKVRTMARGMETLIFNRHLLNPRLYGLFAIKLFSHKVCRWLIPPAALVAVLGLLLLTKDHAWAGVALTISGVALLATWAATRWSVDRPMPRVLALVSFAVAANVAVLHALIRVVHGHEDHLWEPTRRPSTVSNDSAARPAKVGH